MAEKVPQTYANHARWDPPFHFFAVPASAVNLILVIWNLVLHYDTLAAWILLLLILTGIVVAFKARLYPLKAQDRVIRLEQRLRLSALLSEPLRSRAGELTEAQLIALRFVPDQEAPALVQKALDGKLSSKDIKKAIMNWQPDYFRV